MGLELKSDELDLDEPIQVKRIHDKSVKNFGTGGHIVCTKDDVDQRALVLVLEE